MLWNLKKQTQGNPGTFTVFLICTATIVTFTCSQTGPNIMNVCAEDTRFKASNAKRRVDDISLLSVSRIEYHEQGMRGLPSGIIIGPPTLN